jgi:hypothetical protein
MGDVELHSLIPASHAKKRAIEVAAERALARLPGSWTATIIPSETEPLWVTTVEASHGLCRMLLVGPREQDPEAIYDLLKVALGPD